MENLKNIGKKKIRSSKGAISLLVALTIFTFMAILTGTFVTISVLRISQQNSNLRIKQVYETDVVRVDEIYEELTENMKKADGSWNSVRKVNTPKLEGTGLIPVYWQDDGTEVELNDSSSALEWNQWYNYDDNKWANAVTKDEDENITGYFVWIPRFAYKITSNVGNGGTVNNETITGNIDIVFVDINNKNENVTYSETYPTVTNGAMESFVVHPAFTDNIANGGWSSDIPGFWVAKYPAGFQANTITQNLDKSLSITISNSSDTVVNSDIQYTSSTSNVFGTVTANTTYITYPVFKPLTYAYNRISVGDSYSISRKIEDATEFYGLTDIDSHLQKNSEWGAVAYLTQSKYGRARDVVNGGVTTRVNEELNINNYYTVETDPYTTAITGVYAYGENETTKSATQNIAEVKAYNTIDGEKGSSTKNLYGVYDLNGCIWERTAAYIANGNSSLATYGASFTTGNVSTKYSTIYEYDNSNDTSQNNYLEYRGAQTATYGFGDAILETSKQGDTSNDSWYQDYSKFPTANYPFFAHGANYNNGNSAGRFAFNLGSGILHYYTGFRVVLIGK